MRHGLFGMLMLFAVSAVADQVPDSEVVTDVVVETPDDVTYQIGLLLRCPVCQGMPIAESPAEMAQSMMTRIRELHQEGKSKDEIIQYFIDRYGEWVLLEPRAEGLSWMVWIMPPLFLLIGLYTLFSYVKPKVKADVAQSSDTEEQLPEDDYLKAVRDDVLS